jgi:tetratricopeptide (TPR) repeat protein
MADAERNEDSEERARKAEAVLREAAERDMTYGALWAIGGLFATGIGYLAVSEGGGRFIVFTGAIAYGIVRFFRGMNASEKLKAPQTTARIEPRSAAPAVSASENAATPAPAKSALDVEPASERLGVATAKEIQRRASRLRSTVKTVRSIDTLVDLVAERPAGWSPRVETADVVEWACWDDAEQTAATAHEESLGHTLRRSSPSYSEAGYELALAAFEREDWPTAATCLDRALALEPDHPLLWCARGVAYEADRRPQRALACYRRAAASRPWDARASDIARAFEKEVLEHAE